MMVAERRYGFVINLSWPISIYILHQNSPTETGDDREKSQTNHSALPLHQQTSSCVNHCRLTTTAQLIAVNQPFTLWFHFVDEKYF